MCVCMCAYSCEPAKAHMPQCSMCSQRTTLGVHPYLHLVWDRISRFCLSINQPGEAAVLKAPGVLLAPLLSGCRSAEIIHILYKSSLTRVMGIQTGVLMLARWTLNHWASSPTPCSVFYKARQTATKPCHPPHIPLQMPVSPRCCWRIFQTFFVTSCHVVG